MEDISVRDFVVEQKKLLELELKAEEEEEKSIASSIHNASMASKKNDDDERPSYVLRQLEASEISVGLYGRTMVTLTVLDGKGEALIPAHRFSVGDEVEIHSKQKSADTEAIGGVVSTITETSITIALLSKRPVSDGNDNDEQDHFLGTPPLSVIPKSSVEVHRKLVAALDELQRDGTDHKLAGNVVNALFGKPKSFAQHTSKPIEPFSSNLDDSQLEAISFALNSGERPISLLHGPPGTGKTTTVAELIKQAVYVNKYKVLVTANSNVAVDCVLERLIAEHSPNERKRSKRKERQRKLKVVRLGHPARIKASILPYSLESLVQNSEGTEIVSDVRNELQSFLRILSNPKSRVADKRLAYREVKMLRKEVRNREQKVVNGLIREAQVVLATNVGAANSILRDTVFDLVIIDEAAQALEASCWIPILRGKRLVLAGDHCQLPPTIKSKASAVQQRLGTTLFERAMKLYGDSSDSDKAGSISRMLSVQYRMHSDIADWASKVMYHGRLETHESVRSQTLSQLPHTKKSDDDIGETRLLLIDTAGCDMYETLNAAGSRYNDGEAQIVAQHVQALLAMGVDQEEIAVISPYNGQVELLRTLLLPDTPRLEIRSVDGFQGGEREAVVLSLVRSSERGGAAGIGFLKDDRRLNVAVTRAKRHCALICDSDTVSQSKFVKGLIDWMEENGVHRSAIEYLASSQEVSLGKDIQTIEMDLMRIVEATSSTPESISSSESNAKPIARATESEASHSTSIRHGAGLERERKALEEEQRRGLLDKIAEFAEHGHDGDEMCLSSGLSRFDRRVVHEFATQIRLEHRSEGIEGVDRRITLTIKSKLNSSHTEPINFATKETNEMESEVFSSRPPTFDALNIDSDGSSESERAAVDEMPQKDIPSPMNNFLGDLAKERFQRRKQACKDDHQSNTASRGEKKKAKTKRKGQKPTRINQNSTTDPLPDDLDDMAFLDAEIEKVQTSHGRKVAGKGQYRSIVNGILIASPPPQEPRKNQQASSALKAKLKQSQHDRKSKKKS